MIKGSLTWLVALSLVVLGACSDVKIDYSHTVVGTGTVVSDYKMGDVKDTGASGSLRGTGDVINKEAIFANGTSLFTVEDKFLLSQKAGESVKTEVKYPQWPKQPPRFRLVGPRWASAIEVEAQGAPKFLQSESQDVSSYGSLAEKGAFQFQGSSSSASAATSVADSPTLEAGGALTVGPGFDYRSLWIDSSNVTVRSVVGPPEKALFEEKSQISGNSTGRKALKLNP